jgi:hypothetical protein
LFGPERVPTFSMDIRELYRGIIFLFLNFNKPTNFLRNVNPIDIMDSIKNMPNVILEKSKTVIDD